MKYSKADFFDRAVEDALEQWWLIFEQSLDERQANLMEWDDVVRLYWENY